MRLLHGGDDAAIDEDIVQQYRLWGVPEEDIDEAVRSDDRTTSILWPENVEPLRLFLSVQSQWRIVAGFGRAFWAGLDYPGVEAAARMMGLRMTPRLFDDLQVMETEARRLINGGARG